MAEIKRTMLGRNHQAWINFFESFGYPIISVDEEEYICISDVYKFKVESSGNFTFFVNDEGYNTAYQPLIEAGGDVVTVVCNPNFVWVTIVSGYNRRRLIFFYEVVGGMHLYAYNDYNKNDGHVVGTTLTSVGPLTDLDTEYQYVHNERLNFNSEPGTILYTSDVLFQGNASIGYTKTVVDTNFLACTQVPEDQLIVFNMHEFYSMSNHIVVPLGFELEEMSTDDTTDSEGT